MDLGKRFEDATAFATTAYTAVSVSSLEPNTPYPITRAKRLNTKYGVAVVLTLLGPVDSTLQVFLPQRYSEIITDTDLTSINTKAVALSLVYKGVCPATRSYLLAIETTK